MGVTPAGCIVSGNCHSSSPWLCLHDAGPRDYPAEKPHGGFKHALRTNRGSLVASVSPSPSCRLVREKYSELQCLSGIISTYLFLSCVANLTTFLLLTPFSHFLPLTSKYWPVPASIQIFLSVLTHTTPIGFLGPILGKCADYDQRQ